MAVFPELQQISLSLSRERNKVAPAAMASVERQDREVESIRNNVFRINNGHYGHVKIERRLSPFHICASNDFLSKVRNVHYYLDVALIDIVDRWFKDEEANFPQRMPLEEHEEELLRWIDGPGRSVVPDFKTRYGMWRTDYLFERTSSGHAQIQICEINARIAVNGLWGIGFHEAVSTRSESCEKGFHSPNKFDVTREAVFSCFDRTKPIFYIREKWPGADGPAFTKDFERRTGQRVVLCPPSQLQLKENHRSPTGYSLYYYPKHTQNGLYGSSGEHDLEEVHQCALELFQEEYANIDPQVLRQIATCCVNDLRNIFLIHDKRILGIVLEELPTLERRKVLSAEECSQLRDGIVHTLLSGTDAMKQLLERSKVDETQKNLYLVKPVRDALSRGIRPGSVLSQEEWLEILERHASHALKPSEDALVVQHLVDHVLYDMVRHGRKTTKPEKFHMIGSQHLINSKLSVHGPWRIGNEKGHMGFRKTDDDDADDLGILMSCVVRPEGLLELTEKE